VAKPAARPAVKGAGKLTVKAMPKPAVKATSTSAAPAAAKRASQAAPKTVAKAPAKVATRSVARPAAQPAAKAAAKSAAKSAGKAGARPVAAPAASKPVVKKPAVKAVVATAKPVSKAAAASKPKAIASASASPALSRPAPAAPVPKPPSPPVAIEPTPRPLGKRAAKKIMMEQMTQAAVVPSHAPDAAKATFFTLNERPVMTPPVPSSVQKDPKRANNWKSLPMEQLTDQDILSMPDSEYMSDLQLAFFRRKLSQLKADMLANAGETTEHLREDTVVVPDPADRATIEEEHALELRTRDRERKLLKKIEQAIARIDGGDYGYCDETGEPIGVGRLMARPTASLSLEAQQRRELKQKMFGD
jgi:DnaK suppressor protein